MKTKTILILLLNCPLLAATTPGLPPPPQLAPIGFGSTEVKVRLPGSQLGKVAQPVAPASADPSKNKVTRYYTTTNAKAPTLAKQPSGPTTKVQVPIGAYRSAPKGKVVRKRVEQIKK
jgi:hypothetical protein